MSRLRAIVLAVVVVVSAACSNGEAGSKNAARPQPPAREVTLAQATTINLPRVLPVTGTLSPQEELVLGFQVAGRLLELKAEAGDRCEQDQQLAALDHRDFELEVQRAQAAVTTARMKLGLVDEVTPAQLDLEATATVREARAVLADARLARDRLQELVAQNLRAQSDLDAAVAAFEVAQSRVQRAHDDVRTWLGALQQSIVELEISKKRRQDAVISAPWPGKVALRQGTAGQFLAAGAPVFTLLRIDPLRLRLLVPERMSHEVLLGQNVLFTVDGEPAGEHQGKVVRTRPDIDRQSRTLLVEAEVENHDGSLRAGGFCRARIVVEERQEVVVVPRAAVLSFAGVDRVFVLKDGKASEQLVTLGRDAGELVEVVQGLPAGSAVIGEARGLVAGTPVVVKG